jgi:hypothetical protein
MAMDQLRDDRSGDPCQIEAAVVGGELRMERDLQQEVAELFLEVVFQAAFVYRLQDLVRLFEEVDAQGLVGLLLVPRTSVRAPQPRHDESQCPERGGAPPRQVRAVGRGQRVGSRGGPAREVGSFFGQSHELG